MEKLNLFKRLTTIFDNKFIEQNEMNFEKIENHVNGSNEELKKHKSSDLKAHDSKQITHNLWTSKDEMEYQQKVTDNLVLGANGDGVQELRESRVAVTDKNDYPTLNARLKQDFLQLLKNDEDIKAALDSFKDKMKKDLDIIDNPLDRIDYQKGIGSLSARGKDGVSFIQAININKEKDELYVTRKVNSEAAMYISRYKFSTLTYIDERKIKTNSSGAFNEGSVWFYNDKNELCFIIRVNYDQMACIFNYTRNEKSEDFILPGGSKQGADLDKRYFFAHYGDATDILGVYIYDFQSVVNRKPKLIKMLRFDKEVAFNVKPQGITMVNDHLVITRGKEELMVTVLNLTGKVVQEFPLDIVSVKDMLGNTLKNTQLDFRSLKYETEASCPIKGDDGNEYLVIPHIFYDKEEVYLAIAGVRDGYKVTKKDTAREQYYPNWKKVTDFKNDAKPYSNYENEQPQFMMDSDGFINLRGIATYPKRDTSEEWSRINKVLFTLPYPYVNYTNQNFQTVAGGEPDRTNRIVVSRNEKGTTDVILTSTSDNSDKPFCVLDGIRFYSESRLERTELK